MSRRRLALFLGVSFVLSQVFLAENLIEAKNFQHVKISSRDIKETAKFYKEAFKMEEVTKKKVEEKRPKNILSIFEESFGTASAIFLQTLDGIGMEIWEFPENDLSQGRKAPFASGPIEIAFRTQEIDAYLQRALALGAQSPTGPFELFPGDPSRPYKFASFIDPNGINVKLVSHPFHLAMAGAAIEATFSRKESRLPDDDDLYPVSFSHVGIIVNDLKEAIPFYEAIGAIPFMKTMELGERDQSLFGPRTTPLSPNAKVSMAPLICGNSVGILLYEFPDSVQRGNAPNGLKETGFFAIGIQDFMMDETDIKVEDLGIGELKGDEVRIENDKTISLLKDPSGTFIQLLNAGFERQWKETFKRKRKTEKIEL